jgi:hypothetical protein
MSLFFVSLRSDSAAQRRRAPEQNKKSMMRRSSQRFESITEGGSPATEALVKPAFRL